MKKNVTRKKIVAALIAAGDRIMSHEGRTKGYGAFTDAIDAFTAAGSVEKLVEVAQSMTPDDQHFVGNNPEAICAYINALEILDKITLASKKNEQK